jgi:hypothetical protein
MAEGINEATDDDRHTLLASARLSPVRDEVARHVTSQRRAGRTDSQWEIALGHLTDALTATERLAAQEEPDRLGRRDWASRPLADDATP